MKNLKTIIIAFTLILFSNRFNAQETKSTENSTLWKVEHKNLKKPSYILGTIHVMCESDFKMSDKTTRILNEVDALVLEVNLTDTNESKSLQNSFLKTKKISSDLSTTQFQKLDSIFQLKVGIPIKDIDTYGLSYANALLIMNMLPCKTTKYLENELTLLAINNKKSIDALETVTEQLEYMDKAYPIQFLFQQMMLFDSYKVDFNQSITAYLKGDINTASALICKDLYMDENAKKWLLTVRNKNWAKKMPSMMEEKSSLFAVGTAHLTNENGIINLLKQKGYTITPIFE